MCHQIKTLAKNCNGQLTYCTGCGHYHLSFNNLYLEFSSKELEHFRNYVEQIKVEYWENKYDQSFVSRKIPIKTMQQNLTMIFNRQELQSLKNLLFQKSKKPDDPITVMDVDYIFVLN